MTSEINDSCEHDLLISLNSTSTTTPCDTEFEESMMKSTLLDNASLCVIFLCYIIIYIIMVVTSKCQIKDVLVLYRNIT